MAENTRMEVLSEAFDKAESAPEAAPEVVPVVEAAPVESAPAVEVETASTLADRARKPDGTFTKAPKKSTASVKPDDKAATPLAPETVDQGKAAGGPPSPPAAAPVVPKFKAPQSWKPNVREKWSTLPEEVQEEADRLDKEYQKVMRDAAAARKEATQYREIGAPYEAIARSAGMDSTKWLGSIAQTAAALHMGPPQQKAAIVATLIRDYQIDVDAVNAVMQGQPPPQQAQAPQQRPVDVRGEVAKVFEQMQYQQLTNTAQQAIEKAKGDAEFWEDVGEGKVVTLAATLITNEPGLDPVVALKNAYDILSERTPAVSAVLKQRKEAEAAKARIASTQQARVAGGSVRSQPAAVGEAKPVGRMAVLEAGWKKYMER